jgi:hypothetical protein
MGDSNRNVEVTDAIVMLTNVTNRLDSSVKELKRQVKARDAFIAGLLLRIEALESDPHRIVTIGNDGLQNWSPPAPKREGTY